MDRYSSGFEPLPREKDNNGKVRGRREWVRRWEKGEMLGFETFYVGGRDVERSVVTGRRAGDVCDDEGVVGEGEGEGGWVGRRGWRGVVE